MSDFTSSQCSNHCSLSSEFSIVLGEGPIPARFMIIGEAPTPLAQKVGKPFPIVTDSGRVLEKWLSYIEIKRDEAFITNMVKCPKLKDSNQWGLQIRSCLSQLENEILAVNPRIVITLGSDVHKRFTTTYRPKGFQSTLKSPLYRVWNRYPSSGGCGEYNGVQYFALVHPSNAARTTKAIPDYLTPHLNRLKTLVEEARMG